MNDSRNFKSCIKLHTEQEARDCPECNLVKPTDLFDINKKVYSTLDFSLERFEEELFNFYKDFPSPERTFVLGSHCKTVGHIVMRNTVESSVCSDLTCGGCNIFRSKL